MTPFPVERVAEGLLAKLTPGCAEIMRSESVGSILPCARDVAANRSSVEAFRDLIPQYPDSNANVCRFVDEKSELPVATIGLMLNSASIGNPNDGLRVSSN